MTSTPFSPRRRISGLAAATIAVIGLSACTPFGAVVGAGATVGTAAVDERGVSGTTSDVRIRAAINSAWYGRDLTAFNGVGLLVHEGRVVLTGTTATAALHDDAISLARKVEGVTEVYDHIRVDPNPSISDFADDSSIVASMRKRILFDKSIVSLNYDLDASAHTLYIIGIAQDQGEKNRVLAHARAVSGVSSIVEYVRIK